MIKFFIDNKEVSANKGETILEVARREGFYIPTMCYLPKVKPISSCRLCVVEVEGNDGLVLSCQTPAVEGIRVTTNSAELYAHRQNIMKMYDVNHPLECGVCDKSGECDLQNKTLEFNVNAQEFSAREQKRTIQNWNFIQYDPNLCILCEKCVHTCNEAIGDDAIDIEFGGYNSKIVPKGADTLDCTFCGECVAVCPVGALVSKDFKYKANAWELEKVPATCVHCSSGCAIYYETKSGNTQGSMDSVIYRVTNDFEFNSICGAGRFGFDFQNEQTSGAISEAVEALQKADTIRFNSMITNEEALILQKLKAKLGTKLVNPDAKRYQDFTKAYASTSGQSLYGATLEDLKQSDFIITIGTRIATDNPAVRYALTEATKFRKADVVYMHTLEDALLNNVVKQFIKYEVGSEEGVLALLLKYLVQDNLQTLTDSLDDGYLSAESNVGEEELERLVSMLQRKERLGQKKATLVVGEDLLSHAEAKNIAKIVGLIDRYSSFEVMIVPSAINTLGVSLICELDEQAEGFVVGYNERADFTIGAIEGANFNTPALNQQEGTFATIEKKVVATHVATPFKGSTLNDIASALDIAKTYTIDYTSQLPQERGFKGVAFDSLESFYDINGNETRGYTLQMQSVSSSDSISDISPLREFNGTILYRCEPTLQFNSFTNQTHQLKSEGVLSGSQQFAIAAKVADGDRVKVSVDGFEFERLFKIDETLKGTIALNPTFDSETSKELFLSNYRYVQAKIEKVGS